MKANRGLRFVAWVAGLTAFFVYTTCATAAIIWDYSPATVGAAIGCCNNLTNDTIGINWVEQISFDDAVDLTDMDIYAQTNNNALNTIATIRIFTDTAGTPGSLIHEFTEQIVAVDTVGAVFGLRRYHVDFSTSVSLDPLTIYWIGMSGEDVVGLLQMGFNSGPTPDDGEMTLLNGATPFGSQTLGDMAFRLSGTVVPEPSTLLLLGFGLAGLGFFGRRKIAA